MDVRITIVVPEVEYKEAICAGWEERYAETITPADIKCLDGVEDFISAVPYLCLNDNNTTIRTES